MKLHVAGLKELDRALSELNSATAKRLTTKVLKDAGQPVADRASAIATNRTGVLAASFGVGTQLTRRQAKANRKQSDVEVYVGSGRSKNVRAAGPVQGITEEFGTSHNPAHPALRPAWDAGQRKVLDDIKSGLAENIDKAAKRAAKRAAKLAG